MLNYFEEQI